ncbi:HAD-like domain-containing protein [Schizothecium vesticola]|uniref:HAD-like domain-containing protein n=1 Tax=Schizothecium vesticola TaxID=314040 RepID=A0AA40K8L4_9PEZI|nr:HAD-like domain-containing protein [Schizothecium vesticola]
MASRKTIIAFDLYGTLLSTESIAGELAKLFGHDASKPLAALWRRYQLEYTWRINSMGVYRTFGEITRGALHHAAGELGLTVSDADADRLMEAYNALHVFPEIPAALKLVKQTADADAVIFSNGTRDMVAASVATSPDLKPYEGLFRGLVTVDGLGVFKPDRRTYDHLAQEAGKLGAPGNVWVVSANPFDAVGAEAAGLRAAWIDRAGKGWVDRLGDVIGDIRPTIVVDGVDKAVEEILRRSL